MTPEQDRPTRVVVDGFELNGIDDHGVTWRFESITGWKKGAGVDVTQTQRTINHGQFVQPGHRSGKVITIVGRIMAPDRALIPDALDRLNAVLADGGTGVFEFFDRTEGRRWTDVQLLEEPDPDTWIGGPFVRYQLSLLAGSPYRFGATLSASTPFPTVPAGAGLVWPLFMPSGVMSWGNQVIPGTLTVFNHGKAPAPVVFEVEGPTPAAGFRITNLDTGKRIDYLDTPVPAGSTLVMDGRDGTVVIDDVADRSGGTIAQEWPQVTPGGSSSFLFESLGSTSAAVLTAKVTEAYW